MLIWVAALHCEAQPIIDHYRLKKSPSHNNFEVYLKEDMLCIISGIGKTAAAAATAWIAGLNNNQTSIAWINIGTAGSATHALGMALSIDKISDDESNRHFHPVALFDSGLESAHCRTLNKPSTDYQARLIYDMEASAFFETASRFSNAGLVHCLKIISDNPWQQVGRDKSRISELIKTPIAQLASFAESLNRINAQVAKPETNDSDRKTLDYSHLAQTR